MTSTSTLTSSSMVLKSLSILLGVFFLFLGLVKVGPWISKELHKDMRKEFVKFSKVFPLSETLGFKIPSKWYRRVFGGLEILSGITLAAVPSEQLKRGANGVLVLQSLLSIYSHYFADDKFERVAPALVLLFMSGCRLVIDLQRDRKRRQPKLSESTAGPSQTQEEFDAKKSE